MDVFDRFKDYDKDYCWQYEIRQQNMKEDIELAGLTEDEVNSLKTSDFDFRVIDPSDTVAKTQVTNFIKRHEWLGTISIYTTHWFATYYKDQLAIGI